MATYYVKCEVCDMQMRGITDPRARTICYDCGGNAGRDSVKDLKELKEQAKNE